MPEIKLVTVGMAVWNSTNCAIHIVKSMEMSVTTNGVKRGMKTYTQKKQQHDFHQLTHVKWYDKIHMFKNA